MTETAEAEAVYSAIEEAARLVDVPCSREKVLPFLTAYGDALPQSVIAFRVATGERRAGELDCRFTMLPRDADPHDTAVAHGLAVKTDHPVDALLADIRARFPVDCYGIDFGVVGGFKKSWSFFPPDDMQHMAQLAELPSAPESLKANLDFFARHGLDDKGSLIGIDHKNRTMNVYFGEVPAECFETKNILSILHELDMPDPSERMMRLGEVAFGIYTTLSWDSPKVERITFAVMTPDPTALPVSLEPRIEQFVKSAPTKVGADDRKFVYAVTVGPDGEYNKLQSYYQWQPRIMNLMLLESGDDDA